MKYYFTLTILCLTLCGSAQTNLWSDIALSDIAFSRNQQQVALPTEYRAVQLNTENLSKKLTGASKEFSNQKGLLLPIPMPDGSMETFEIWESPIMEEGLASRYPGIKTYKGKSVNNPLLVSRLGFSKSGFHAIIQSPEGLVLIEPIAQEQLTYYTVSFAKNMATDSELAALQNTCGTPNLSLENLQKERALIAPAATSRNSADPVDLYIYKAAIACSGEYAQFHRATTKEAALAQIVATLNRVNMVFERDLAIRIVLIDNNDEIIFLDPATDPYTDGEDVPNSYQENPAAIEKIIPVSEFDIGHVFIAGCGSGVVGIGGGKVCDGSKSFGISCQNSSSLTRFSLNIVAHEMGHQLYANHSWNTCPGNEGQHASGTAYEPGSGSTIMSYAGACGGGNNIQNSADDYFHVTNLEEILLDKLSGRTNACAEKIATNNNKPVASTNYTNGFYIPFSTPFELVGEGTDENGDELTYCWEQYDRGPSTTIGEPMLTTPTFRSFQPVSTPNRTFPRMADVLNNRIDKREVLPTYSRMMTFRMTVRDNNVEAGGVDWTTVSFNATDQAGPFLVQFPNVSSDFVEIGDFIDVQWDVANTNGSLVNCQKVNILLSTDGGKTFPTVLVENTDNDGSQSITVPNIPSSEARIKIAAADNIFFDISNQNFNIISSATAGFSFAPSFQEQQVCLPATVEVDLTTISLLNFNQPITFTSSLADNIPAFPGFSETFVNNTTSPGETNKLVINLPADFPHRSLDYTITGSADGATNVTRTLKLNLVSNQFETFAIQAPENGSSGLGLPRFMWTPTIDAAFYQIDIATSPAFGETIIDNSEEVFDTFYIPAARLPESTIFYWRVRPVNDCGIGTSSQIFAFQTQNLSCTSQAATEVPLNISSIGTPTVESKMTVTENFEIKDLNVLKIRGSHDKVNHIRATLVSPKGTTAVLLERKCPASIPINLGFDDESPNVITCPPNGGTLHQPIEPLSIFDGESSFGEWILRIEVTDGFGDGGSLEEWSLEFCGDISLDPPTLVTNEVLPVKPKSGRLINNDFLLAEDANNSAAELVYTLVQTPTIGSLLFNKEPIAVGTQFTQADLNNGNFKYRHDTEATEGTDQFTFTVSDGEGGWIGITPFDIVIDPSATTVGIKDILNENLITIYPNPANDIVQVDFGQINTKKATISLFDMQGKHLLLQNVDNPSVINIVTNSFENGLYFIKVEMAEGVLTKKLVVQR